MKKSMKSGLVVLYLITSVVLSAQSPIQDRIQKAKTANMQFIEATNLLLPVDNKTAMTSSEVKAGSYFDFSSEMANQLIQTRAEYMSLEVPMEAQKMILDIAEVDISFYDYEVVTSSGDEYYPTPDNGMHYRGVVRGKESSSIVALSIFKDRMMGIVSISSEGNYNIGKLQNSATHMIYKDQDLLKPPPFHCETSDDEFAEYDANMLLKGDGVSLAAAKCVKIYLETEYDIFQSLGSVANVVNYITGLYNQVAILYANESIQTKLSQIKVWNTVDPYTGGNTATLLSQFQAATSSINGNLGQLLTFRNIGGGRAAGFSGICNSNVDNSLSVSRIYSTYSNVPTYSWSVMVVTHEFGHLFGSRHTHACVWNGNNTAIDGCSGFTEGSCALPGIPAGGGTIMSYCHTKPVGINFNLGFGPQPGNVIRNRVATGACLGTCVNCPANLSITSTLNGGTHDFVASSTITATNAIINSANVHYGANTTIYLNAPFRVNAGCNFKADLNGCTPALPIKSAEEEHEALAEISTANELKIYPNPSLGVFTIEQHSESAQLVISDLTGKEIYHSKLEDHVTLIDLSNHPKGIYIVKTNTGEKIHVTKIIIE